MTKKKEQSSNNLSSSPKHINDEIKDDSRIQALSKELSKFKKKNHVWNLVPSLLKTIIRTRWFFRN